MYPNYRIPNYNLNMRRNNYGFRNNNGDRFVGGFAVPFLLGGITGGLLARPNNFYGGFQQYPVFVPYNYNYGYPTYSQNYYYY